MTKNILQTSIAAAFSVLAIVFAVHASTGVFSNRPSADMFSNQVVEKTGRYGHEIASADMALEDESEWVLDCYDQFGPDGSNPVAAKLKSCLPS